MNIHENQSLNAECQLDENDLWIAATARALGAIVVTTDSDFQRVSGLQIEDWTQ